MSDPIQVIYRKKKYTVDITEFDDLVSFIKLKEKYESSNGAVLEQSYTLDKLIELFKEFYQETITEATLTNYISQLKKLFEIIDGNFIMRKIYDIDHLYEGISILTESKSSIKLFLVTIKKIYYLFNENVPTAIGTLIDSLQETIIDDNKTFTPKEENGLDYLTANVDRIYKELVKTYEDSKTQGTLQELTLFILYSLTPPLRRDWANVKVFDTIVANSKENYILRGTSTLYLNNYKCVSTAGKLVLDYNKYPLAGKYIGLLQQSIADRGSLFTTKKGLEFKPTNFSRFLIKIYGSSDIQVNMLRKWYANQVTSQAHEGEIDTMNTFMAHTHGVTKDYYLKD